MKPLTRNPEANSSQTSTTLYSAHSSEKVPAPAMVNTFDSNTEMNVNRTKNLHVPAITGRTALMTLLVAMGGFIFGYDTGQISGFLEMDVFLHRFGEQTSDLSKHRSGYYFTNLRSGLIVGLLSVGTCCGCLIAGPLANAFGRKTCIPGWCFVFCIGVIAQMVVGPGEWIGIAVGRSIAGLGVGGLSVLVPMYMAETSPVSVRGAVISCYQLFITIGIFVADCINYETEGYTNTASYRLPMGIGLIWAVILGVGMLFLPETPRYDWNHGNSERARKTMAAFYGVDESHPTIERESAEIEKVCGETIENRPWYKAIRGPRMRYRVCLAMGLQMLQQLTGANYFFYYGTTIFTGVGMENSFVTAMVLGGVNVAATFLGVYMARRFRRRESLWIAALWQSMCFFVFASVGQFQFRRAAEGSAEAKRAGTLMIVFACLFILGFASTWGPLVWACIGEMFPYRYRAVAMAFATSANWCWNFLLAFFTPFITTKINYAYGYVFAGCNLAAFFVVYFFLVESSGKTLEEIDKMYLMNVKPIGSHAFQFPAESRAISLDTDAAHLVNRHAKLPRAKEAGGVWCQ